MVRQATTRAGGVPAPLARAENRLLRPRDFPDLYVNPHAEFARLVERGYLAKVAHGYYLLIPEDRRGGYWQPEIEAVALGIAVADYGRDNAAVMGPGAARLLGALPRALATTTTAVPRQRPVVHTAYGDVQFVKRKIETLEVQRIDTEVVIGWVTTPEQTALDLADRPTLGEVTPALAGEMIRQLARGIEPRDVEELAQNHRKRAAWQRYCWAVGLPPPVQRRVGVPTLGLPGGGEADLGDYGMAETRP